MFVSKDSYMFEMIRTELADAVGADFVSTGDSDKFGHSIDYYWIPEMWHDRGLPTPKPDFVVESGAGAKAGFPDEEYKAAGANIVDADFAKNADFIAAVRKPEKERIADFKRGAFYLSLLDPFNEKELIKTFADAGITAASFEMIPRSTIAQKMDVLSSQSNLAGYVSVIKAANALKKILPMMMTPAGTISPLKFFIVGVGVAGLQAIATAKRLGADVTVVYRRTEKELPARREEVEHAMEEGIEFKFLTNPVKIEGEEGWVKSILCQQMELSEPDESGRARPVPIEGSEYEIDADCVIMSIGTSPNPLIKSTTKGLEVNKRGGIIVNEETGATSKEGVYAGGDAVTGAATVILAMGAGKTAAKAIDEYISSK